MEPIVITMGIIGVYLAINIGVSILARIRGTLSMEKYLLAGRALGIFLLYFMVVADIYSGFAFLGCPGWAYKFGAPVAYVFAYASIAYTVGYYVGPMVRRFGRKLGFVTEPDFFEARYESPTLGTLVAIIGIAFFLPYIQLQLMGGGLVFSAASYGTISTTWGMIIATVVAAVYVFTSGLRGTAWISLIQAILMFGIAAVSLGWIVPMLFGSVGGLFAAMAATHPKWLVLPGGAGIHPPAWYASTALLCGLGFFMWPHLFADLYTAESEDTLKRTFVFSPLYTFMILFVTILGFAALLKKPGITPPDMSVLEIIKATAPTWLFGLLGAGGLAATMSTYDTLALCGSGLVGENIYHKRINPAASDERVAWVTRWLLVPILGVSLLLAVYAPKMLVRLLLIGYSGITQFFPGVILGLHWKRVSKAGVLAGMIAGVVVASIFAFTPLKPPFRIHEGLWGLMVNFLITIPVSLVTKPPSEKTLKDFELL